MRCNQYLLEVAYDKGERYEIDRKSVSEGYGDKEAKQAYMASVTDMYEKVAREQVKCRFVLKRVCTSDGAAHACPH